MFGKFLKLDILGASHAKAIRFTLENFPKDFPIDLDELAAFMERRAPGRDRLSTQRREPDKVEFVSGFYATGMSRPLCETPHSEGTRHSCRVSQDDPSHSEGTRHSCRVLTNGDLLTGIIRNTNVRPQDYGTERTVPRPGHADFGQWIQFGRIPTGGGKNSGRLTAALCAAGGLAKQYLASRGISVVAELGMIGGKTDEKGMTAAIEKARKAGDSVGGVVSCTIVCPPVGLGGPLEEGLESALSAALFAIPGVKGVTFGAAGDCCDVRGSKFNDAFVISRGEVVTAGVRHGGILGGRTSGMPITFDVWLKPTPTVYVEQESVDLATMKPAKLKMTGRHDPCIVRRAVPVVEAVAALTLADALLADEAAHPRICLTLTGKTLEEDLAQYEAERYFTDMVELRVDLLDAKNRARAAEFPEMLRTCGHTPRVVPVILTYRRKSDGGAFEGGEQTRIAFFKRILTQSLRHSATPSPSHFAYVDFEEGFGDEDLVRLAHKADVKIVRSFHSFKGPVKNLSARLRALAAQGDIAKLAFMPRSLADVSRLFSEMSSKVDASPLRCVVLAMGSLGLATRVLASRLGAPWTYASVGGLEGLGHVTPHELVRDYRFRSVTREATLFGVTGWPLAKTRSPELHNAAFLAEDEDAVMIPFPAKTAKEALAFMKAMKMRGMAVTIPHKQTIMPLLDKIDPLAKKIGAVNTVSFENGKYVGYNTDATGFAEALTAFAGEVRGKRVALLGNGGAAQAVKAALKRLGAKFEVFHRKTPPQGFDLLVNATPVDPIPEYAFTGRELVYDLRYVPAVTPLMERAAKAGCRVENGFAMLVNQARLQRLHWGV